MPIISVSLSNDVLRDVDALQRELGFSGRSELIRAGLRMLAADTRQRSQLTGIADALVVVIHDGRSSHEATVIRHAFEDIIKTQLHHQLGNHKCLELFLVRGEAKRIKELVKECQTNKKMDVVRLILP